MARRSRCVARYKCRTGPRSNIRTPRPPSAMASIRRGLSRSSVLVDGSVCTPAITGAGVNTTVGVAMAGGVVTAAAVGATVAIGVVVGATVGVADGATVNGGRVGGMRTGGMATDSAVHVEVMKVSLIIVTVPLRASARPLTVTPFAKVTDVRARIVPTKVDPDPSAAELVICQNTLHGLPPLTKTTELVDAVTRSDCAWKIQTELGSFWPSSVSVPVRSRVAGPELYTPATSGGSPPSAA